MGLRDFVGALLPKRPQPTRVTGLVERCSGYHVDEYKMCITVLVEGQARAHRHWFPRDGGVPVELTQPGDLVHYTVAADDSIIGDSFKNTTLSGRLANGAV